MGEQVAAGLPLKKNNMEDHVWGCSSVGRAPALQAGGQGFESLHLHASNEQCLIKTGNAMQVHLHERGTD